jgi:(E)-4-hydroxy-3-methylbut-2-enyl-diphosphate synthase
MIASNKLLVERMIENGYYYPVHLGVTEAGDGIDGRLKSAAGIGNLLLNGIGDTIRVSLTEKPENEIPVAKELVRLYGKKAAALADVIVEGIAIEDSQESLETLKLKPPYVIATAACEKADFVLGPTNNLVKDDKIIKSKTKPLDIISRSEAVTDIIKLTYHNIRDEELQLRSAAEFSYLNDLLQAKGICIKHNKTSSEKNAQLSLNILQALGMRFSKAEFIACPSCGRTYFDLESHLKKVQQETLHLKGIKIAVMGCVVNGLGEMAGADYGYVGSGTGRVSLYKGSELVHQNIDEKDAIATLISLIKESGDWKNKYN